MTNNTDAQIARQWAEANIDALTPTEPTAGVREAIARHILDTTTPLTMADDTTTPLTMADIVWDDEVHSGLCAEHTKHGTVLMISKWRGEIACCIKDYDTICKDYATLCLDPKHLTPIPGRKIDLTPRSGSEPETTPEHPEFLETEEDYENAPDGTIVAQDGGKPFVLIDELWMDPNSGIFEHGSMADIRRRVLRWGWGK